MIRQTAAVGVVGLTAVVALSLVAFGATAIIAGTGAAGHTTALVGATAPSGDGGVESERLDGETAWQQETRTIRVLTATGPGEELTVHSVDQTIEAAVVIETETPTRRVLYPGGAAVEYQFGPPSVVTAQAPYTEAGTVVLPVSRHHGGGEPTTAEGSRTYQAQGTHLAIETADRDRWQPYFDAVGLSVVATDLRFPGDSESSVVVALPPEQDVRLQLHDPETKGRERT